ncbi:hypothetical protein [Streptomyces sp. NBC_00094]|uniref:hypothetical protein n=1 Tax=Streptomyces sp. NBC_00094 TaxID=2903620 RepID=UPI002B1D4C01|nr:hypothetical protein [Streptomyces sp. NBC_00094]
MWAVAVPPPGGSDDGVPDEVRHQTQQEFRRAGGRCRAVGDVEGNAATFGDVRGEPVEHDAEGVGEFAELVTPGPPSGSGGRRTAPRPQDCRLDPGEQRPHSAGEEPALDETGQEQEAHRRRRGEGTHEEVAVGRDPEEAPGVIGDESQEEAPHHGRQQDARNGENPA